MYVRCEVDVKILEIFQTDSMNLSTNLVGDGHAHTASNARGQQVYMHRVTCTRGANVRHFLYNSKSGRAAIAIRDGGNIGVYWWIITNCSCIIALVVHRQRQQNR